MAQWKKTSCVLCPNSCGLEVNIENNKIIKVRGDKDNPRSQGYTCRKGLNIRYFQHHADRLMFPLKRVGNSFERISWEQAIDEIAGKLSATVGRYGPRSFAIMLGQGSIGCPSQLSFAGGVLRGMGSQYAYSALAQELTGRYWIDGKTLGSQSLHSSPQFDKTDMLLTVGWNPMMSHLIPQARRFLKGFKNDPEKILVVVDPRLSETAKIADIHLPIRPGTDALFYRAMISIILKEGWHNQKYIDEHVSGFEKIQPWYINFDEKAALEICELDYIQVKEVCRLFTTRKSSHQSELGVLMTRHSTLISYLETVFCAVTGRIGVEGGNIFPINLRGVVRERETPDEREARMWRTLATGIPGIANTYPPNVMPEEIMSDHPERLRAVIVTTTNPLRSFADTTAYEEAFQKLDLLVTVDPSMTETAALSHYVLPARNGYESWDGGFGGGFPKIFMNFKQPVVAPDGEQLEGGEIFLRLADRLGLIPEIPDALYKAADNEDRLKFGETLMEYFKSHPKAARSMPYILGKTLGKKLGSVHLASLWGTLQNLAATPSFQDMARRVGFNPGPALGEEIFQSIIEKPQGLFIGEVDESTWDHFQAIATKDGRIHLDVPEMEKWIAEIDPALESEKLEKDKKKYPFVMSAGRHWDVNANTQMRDPEWNRGRRACTVTMHPNDVKEYGFRDGQMVRIITEAGEEVFEIEVTDTTRPGYIVIPHGFGLVFQGKPFAANANRLAKNTHRDRIAATPLHRYVPCRVEPI